MLLLLCSVTLQPHIINIPFTLFMSISCEEDGIALLNASAMHRSVFTDISRFSTETFKRDMRSFRASNNNFQGW